MSDEQKARLERWGMRVSLTLGLFTFIGTVLAAGAWAENQRGQVEDVELRVRELDAEQGRIRSNLETLNRNVIRMAVKAGIPRGEMEDLR